MLFGMNLNRLYAYAVALVLILGIVIFGVRQYGDSRVAAQELSTLQKASQEAQEGREAAVKVDALQATQGAAKRDAVRAVLKRKQNELVQKELPDCVGDAERIRLLNDAIGEVNRSTTSGLLPERL